MTRPQHGLVVGKFSPLHRGHELVIETARAACERLLVLSWSAPEEVTMPAALRERWLRLRFPHVPCVVLDVQRLQALCAAQGVTPVLPIPGNDEAALLQREFVLWLCMRVLQWPVDAVFTSEDYGDSFASHLQRGIGHAVRHVSVDRARRQVPISGTALRQAIVAGGDLRAWVAPEINADVVRRVCLLGGESTGKSTLATALAERLGTACVAEFGREWWEARGGTLLFSDLLHIGEEQVRREHEAAAAAPGWLICDTSPLTTLFYCLDQFGRAHPRLWQLALRPYHRVFLCAPDFPFVQDGTRREPAFRDRQHAWYQRALQERDVVYEVLQGGLEERVAQALHHLGHG